MNIRDLIIFLKERTALSILPENILEAIAPLLQEIIVPSNKIIVEENQTTDKLYILQTGRLTSESQTRQQDLSLLPGSILNLYSSLLKEPAQYTVKTLSQTRLWFLEQEQFKDLVQQYPEIIQVFSRQIAAQVKQLSSQLNFEQTRQTILRPYLVSKAKRGVIGKSRYAVRLRTEIKKAAKNQEPVLIFGEPGLEKDNLAALIHFGSALRREAIIMVDCAKLQISGADLFGRAGGKPGLLEALGKGTLILNNIEQLPQELWSAIAKLIKTRQYLPVSSQAQSSGAAKTSAARIIIISEKRVKQIKSCVPNVIKVPPLRVRKADLDEHINYYINLISRNKCIKKTRIIPEALRKLQAYDFPNNSRELASIVERALTQLQGCEDITEEIVWRSQSKKKRYRFNLLNRYPQLRNFLRSNWYPERINYWVSAPLFAFVVAVLFLAPQNRQENFALNIFWAWWWPLILIGFPFIGRLWCTFCPFMIYGEITQKISLYFFPRQLKKWPRQTADKYGGWFLFALFALILLWEELWDLNNTAYLSAWLLLLITAGAIVCSLLFERRFWCRYLCPIGGMNGMFAKLSITELRAQQGTCSAECSTYQCYKGGVAKGEGQETNGCPLYSHPAQLEENKDCVLCMTCLKACPHRSVEFNLRPPGIELWTSHRPKTYEVALLFLLLNLVFLHHLSDIENQLNLNFHLDLFSSHLSFAIAALVLPLLLPLFAQALINLVSKWQNIKTLKFIDLAYGYLPLVLAGNLAHYLDLGLNEAGRILPVTMATVGLNVSNLPILVAHPAVISFLQGTTLIVGVLCSVILTQKIARQSFKFLLPQHLVIIMLAFSMSQIM
ncbi:transcriptional regulators containing an AAA-type ATPase domain and a DNA-binding domain [Xenococcus sp. PCC 7305]|uniref:sigma 54-interacting transcriptional regulator n=1 Tax=Xenococcus sp. PCC 7305 TaxID=102125 RepID=UPI0002AC96F0|nr:sigma 54-interacting transcriptional regulator [Xenococcus sp. PCC 7305]ELS00453.1 transcriptional regulators containing an AAA-type ATPase domain and a DNA-binding domain [Xenococcus sp. PCC 7305]